MNVARMKAPLESELMASYDDDRLIVSFSVWESVETLKALWWIPAGHIPTIDEAKERLAHLQTHGPSPYAFGFKSVHHPDGVEV
jgi:hypothetical protein